MNNNKTIRTVCVALAILILFIGSYIVVLMSVVFILHLSKESEQPTPYFSEDDLIRRASHLVHDIVYSDNPHRCHDCYRMNKDSFIRLCQLIEQSVEETGNLSVEVQLAIYLDWISHYPTLRKQHEMFKLSHDRILFARRNVRRAIMKNIYPQYVRFPSQVANLQGNHRMKYFQGAYGCIDGSHFPIEVRSTEKDNWRNRKGFISTNALLITDVENNLLFIYAMFGAEGCGGDSVVLRYASANDLNWLINGFLIGDAGYALSRHLLTPYRGVRYHLKEFSETAAGRPQTKEELFNLRHATLRNQIERAIGVLKKRFRILREPLVLGSKESMWETFYSCIAVHNFIRIEDRAVDWPFEVEIANEQQMETINDLNLGEVDDQESCAWRDEIAQEMWNNYRNNY